MRIGYYILFSFFICCSSSPAGEPSTQPQGNLPFISVDAENKQVRVACEASGCQNLLEFFCVVAGTSEHESVLRTKAKPSNIHLALLMLGLEPGEPVKYSEVAKKWFPPHGPPLNISCEFEKDGKVVRLPAHRMLRDVQTKKPMPPMTWIFAGSRQMPDGMYAADVTGYVISVVNFELTLIDIPAIASSANETLEWIADPDLGFKPGAPVTLILEPAGAVVAPPATNPTTRLSDVSADQEKLDELQKLWHQRVAPHDKALHDAAQAHYDVISQLRREQQRLIDEADRIQRMIDDFEQKYQNMTTPRPASVEK